MQISKRILLAIVILSSSSLLAQNIKYSVSSGHLFSHEKNLIIGKLENNILVWQYSEIEKKSEFLIYDSNLLLKKTVSTNFFPQSSVLCQSNFINNKNYFDLIIQYYSDSTFYCKFLRFNSDCEMQSYHTLDSVRGIGLNESDIYPFIGTCLYAFIESEDNKYHALIKGLFNNEADKLCLNYFLLFDNKIVQKNERCIQLNNEPVKFSHFYIDNNGNIIFATIFNSQLPGYASKINLYSIQNLNDIILLSNQIVPEKNLFNFTIAINNKKNEYLLTGLYKNTLKDQAKEKATAFKGLFSYSFSTSLHKIKDTCINFRGINGFKRFSTNEHLIFHPQVLLNQDEYVITLSAWKAPWGIDHSEMEYNDQEYIFQPSSSVSNFLSTPPYYSNDDNYAVFPKITYGLPPQDFNTLGSNSNPIYYVNTNRSSFKSSSYSYGLPSGSIESRLLKGRLVLFGLGESNSIKWVQSFQNITDERKFVSLFDKGTPVKINDSLYILYANRNPNTFCDQVTLLNFTTGNKVTSDDTRFLIYVAGEKMIDRNSLLFPVFLGNNFLYVKLEIN